MSFEAQIKEAIANCISHADMRYDTSLLGRVNIEFNKRSKNIIASARVRAFQQQPENRLYSLHFNAAIINERTIQSLIHETVPHEVAHLVGYYNPSVCWNHNPAWKKVCRELGGNGQRLVAPGHVLHQALSESNYVRARRAAVVHYRYQGGNGGLLLLSKTQHNRVQRGAVYMSKAGRIDKDGFRETVMG